MQETLTEQLGALRAWQQTQLRLLRQLQPWLKQQGLYTLEIKNSLEKARRALHDDHLTIAVAGEFSRGKTELINALFFADHGRRLLPADVGRTTMCPTEIFCDPDTPPQLRLLPIETRRSERSLAALRRDPAQWQVFDLDLGDTASLGEHLQRLTEHMPVSRREAGELGLSPEPEDADAEQVRIPRWRLAELNIRHPLLAEGLRILDTPGLNAIGNEPELTYEMLPAAHAVLFVLAADTGVTRSDLQVWNRFVQRPGRNSQRGLMVVLNKTDTLWDELRTPHQITESIVRQCRDVADTLGVAHEQIFATSAQKALLARVQNNPTLERRSGIAGLESHLARTVIDHRLEVVRQQHTYLIQQMLETLEGLVRGRLARNAEQCRSLSELAGQSDGAIAGMLEAAQQEHARYQNHLKDYKQALGSFNGHARELLRALDIKTLDQTLEEIRKTMTGAWTTHGLKTAMRVLLSDIDGRIETATQQAQDMRRLLRGVYRRFQEDHGTPAALPPMYSVVRHQVELSLLGQEAEIFRNSARMTLMEQHFVTKRYFRTIVARAQRIMRLAHAEARQWSETALMPLGLEIRGHRDALAQQVRDVQQAGDSRKTIQQRIDTLQRDNSRLHAQLKSIGKAYTMLTEPQIDVPALASGQN